MKINIENDEKKHKTLSDLKGEDTRICLLINKSRYKKLKTLAVEKESTVSQLIRVMVEDFLNKN